MQLGLLEKKKEEKKKEEKKKENSILKSCNDIYPGFLPNRFAFFSP